MERDQDLAIETQDAASMPLQETEPPLAPSSPGDCGDAPQGDAESASMEASDADAQPDMASFYAAAAAAGTAQSAAEAESSPGKEDAHDEEIPPSDPDGADDACNLPEGPHGPLPELAEEETDSEGSPLPLVSSHESMEASLPAQAAADDEDPEDDNDGAEDDVSMGILGHLGELRRRVMRMFIAVFLGWIALYGVSEILYDYLSAPLQACLPEGSKLIYTSPQGAFFTYLKVAFIASLFATCPYTFYQAWAFIAPGLYREEKRALLPLAFCSSLFFVGGAAFCFFLVFPLAFRFFMGFATDTIVPMISVEEYLSFALKLLIAFGLVFEMPLFSFFLSRFGLLTPAFMRRTRSYAILVIFIVAAILTPPDVISQFLMAMPMIVLYEVSIYVSKVAYREKEAKKQKENNP